MKEELDKLGEKYGENVIQSKNNTISIGKEVLYLMPVNFYCYLYLDKPGVNRMYLEFISQSW